MTTQKSEELGAEVDRNRTSDGHSSLVQIAQGLIDHYEKRITDLDEKVQGLTPQNSSLPPSTQHPHAKPRRPKRGGKKRKRGGQKGHKKHHRGERCNGGVNPQQGRWCRGGSSEDALILISD